MADKTEKNDKAEKTDRADKADEKLADDILIGARAIAEFLFGDPDAVRKVYYLVQKGRLPIFRLRWRICARKSTLLAFIKEQEERNKGNTPRGDGGAHNPPSVGRSDDEAHDQPSV